jgi:hypothetical protein
VVIENSRRSQSSFSRRRGHCALLWRAYAPATDEQATTIKEIIPLLSHALEQNRIISETHNGWQRVQQVAQ